MSPKPRTVVRSLRHDADQHPFIVIWEVTRACDLVCQHCRADAVRDRHPLELTTDQGHELLDQIARFGPPRPLVVLTGGDPFERDDLADLVAHGTKRGLSIALSPSVTPRLDRSALQTLRTAGARAVSLSLDGADATTHDEFRGVDGVFDATLRAARMVREEGMRLQLNTTVTRSTVRQLPGVLRHVLDLDAFLWSVFFLVTTGRGATLQPLDATETEDVLHWLADVARHVPVKTTEAPHFRRVVLQRATRGTDNLVRDFRLGPTYLSLRDELDDMLHERPVAERVPRPPLDVNAGRGFVFIDHVGAVYPSGFLPVPAGSVRDRSLVDLYRNAPLLRRLRRPDDFHGRCGICEFAPVCGGSRSRAYATTGDPFADDPACSWQPAATLTPGA
jgi:radical SAM protein